MIKLMSRRRPNGEKESGLRDYVLDWMIYHLEKLKSNKNDEEGNTRMKKEKKAKKAQIPYMMNRELSWLKFNERVLNEAESPSTSGRTVDFYLNLSVQSG